MIKRSLLLVIVLLSMAGAASAQDKYQVPAKALVDLADAPAVPSAFPGPGEWPRKS